MHPISGFRVGALHFKADLSAAPPKLPLRPDSSFAFARGESWREGGYEDQEGGGDRRALEKERPPWGPQAPGGCPLPV